MQDDTQKNTFEKSQQRGQQGPQAAILTQMAGDGNPQPDRLCQRCSLVPTTRCPPRDLYCSSIDLATLSKSPCKICRLIGRVMVLYRPGPEVYKLIWEPCPDERSDIMGNLSLVPLYIRHDASGVRIPVGSMVTSASNTVDTVLKSLYPGKVDMNRIITWLGDCDASRQHHHPTHTQCARDSQDLLQNLRVIDCRTRHIVAAPKHCKFVALSYVWGLPTVLAQIQDSKLPASLPQTIEDSINVALILGYTYIWIDRYVSLIVVVEGTGLIELVHRANRRGR